MFSVSMNVTQGAADKKEEGHLQQLHRRIQHIEQTITCIQTITMVSSYGN